MKFEISKDTFLDKLSLASHFTSDKLTTSTALQGILLKIEQSTMHLFATNLSTYFHTKIPVKTEETISVIIEPRKFIEFLQLLPSGPLTINAENNQLTVTQQKTKGNFPTLVAEDFPLPPEGEEQEERMEADFFAKHLSLVMFSASKDDARPVLTGVNFVVSDEELLMVSTDGFRLSMVKEKRKGQLSSMIIPAEFLDEVLRNVKEAKEVFFRYLAKEKTIVFRVQDDLFFSRLIEGDFPPFERVIPSEVKTTVKVDRSELLRNIKLVSIFARDFSNVIVCHFKNGELTMRPKKEANEENKTTQEIDFKGEELQVAFNFKYLLDFLNHVDTKEVTMELLRSDAPVVFKLEKNPSFMHIIMPVRIQE